MSPPRRNFTASQAAARLGVSAKALRLYEQQRLIEPGRSAAGWRLYDAEDLARAAEVVSLRALGLSLGQIARVLGGDSQEMDGALATLEERLRSQATQVATTLRRVAGLRDNLARGRIPNADELIAVLEADDRLSVGFALPWPWGGEWFALHDIQPLNFITGPLGSGKTRFAEQLANALPDACFLGLDRLTAGRVEHWLAEDPELAMRVARTLDWLDEEGAERSDALHALIVAFEADRPSIIVVDMVEQGLSGATQQALIASLRRQAPRKRALFLMTRSSSTLDLDLIGADEAVIYCPANHSPPFRIVPYPGGQGHEAVATCLAPPEVRARTAGVVAMRPNAG